MSSKQSLRTCCVIKCVNINTPLNIEVNFFKFPATRNRSFQRNKWIQAVKRNNGPWWLPNADSLICEDHFVNGKPSDCPLNVDYEPSVFVNMKKGEIKSRTVTVKEFALQYIEFDALLEKPTKSNIGTDQRRIAYVRLAAALQIPVPTVRSWEKRFREYYEQKMAELAEKQQDSEDVKPHWLGRVAKRLGVPAVPLVPALGGTGGVATGAALSPGGTVSPGGVVAALCAAARARGTLCSTALYNDVRRSLRLSAAINDLHAVWVSVQRVSLEQVVVAARAGDAGPAPHTAAVADLVLLHTDVDMHRLITDESVTLYEESAALYTLWQLVQRHQLEEAVPMDSRVRSLRWTRAHRDYVESGRSASLVVLQRRWHELKLQARVRLAAHWRRRDPAPAPAAPAPAAPAPAAPAPAAPAAAPPPPASRDMYPRPAPIHIAILKRYPHVATGAFKSWRQQVLDGAVVTKPLEEDTNTEQTEDEGNEKPKTTEPLQPDIKVNEPKTEKPAVDKPDIEKTEASEPAVEQNSVDEPLADMTNDNDEKVDDPPVVEAKCKPLVKETTTGDPLTEHLTDLQPSAAEPMDSDLLAEQSASNDSPEKSTVNELKVKQNKITEPAVDNAESAQLTFEDFQAVHVALDTPMDICDVLDEVDATDDLETGKPVVNDVKVEKNMVNDSSSDDPATGQPTANDLAAEQPPASDLLVVPPEIFKRMYNNLLNEEGTRDNQFMLKEPKFEQATNKSPLADNTVAGETTNSALLDEQSTTDNRLLLKEPKVEQATNINPLAVNPVPEETTNSALLDGQCATDDRLLLKEPKVEQATNIIPLAGNPVTEETINTVILDDQPTTNNPEVIQTTENDLSVEQGKVDNPLPKKNSVLLALLTADDDNLEINSTKNFFKTKRFVKSLKNLRIMNGPPVRSSIGEQAGGIISSDVLAGPETHERLKLSSELVLHDEDKSNELIRPYYQANSSHIDTDSEDNLVIDECSNNPPCLLEPEPMANTAVHGVDTALPHTTIENVAPTIQVLQMIDPSTVKKEILFESDEEDSQPCVEEDKVDTGIKKEVSVLANKIVFANEEPVISDVKTEDDVTERMNSDESQEGDDLVDDTSAIDHKLLMDTKVLLIKIDKTRAWKKNVRKDNSIRVSRIHRRFYTPSTKKYYYTPMSNNKTNTTLNLTKKYWRANLANRKNQPNTRNSTSNSNDQTNTDDINIDDSCLQQVANTYSVRQLCRNIKREMIDDTLEDHTPKKRIKTESDSDDSPSLTKRNVKETEIQGTGEQTETADASVQKKVAEVLSSEDENDELLFNFGWEDKRKKASTRAASSIEWSSQFAPVYGRRVTLPDRAALRRAACGPPVAQVAPISTGADKTETSGKNSAPVDTPADAADDDTPLAWRALDLPTDDQLEAALDELTSCSVDQALERTNCCAARRHREVNDMRLRIGLSELPPHTHSEGVCTCCCAHLSDSAARSRLAAQLRALHDDIERMLWKTAVGRTQTKLAQKRSRSPSPTSTNTLKPSTKDIPLNTATEPTSSKSKPLPTEANVTKPSTYTNRSKKRRSKRAPTPTEDPAPIVDYYEEWQRQKTVNAQYFQIKGLNSSKKNKSKTPDNVTQSSTPQSVTQSGAPQTMVQRTTPPTVVQSTIPLNVVQSTTPRNIVQSVPSTVAHSMIPLQNTSTGLMPYIRESRLIAPVRTSPVTHTIEVPTLVPVIYQHGIPSRVLEKPQKGATPSQLPRPNPRTIAPKPENMRRASEAQHKLVKPGEEEPQLTNPFSYQTHTKPRRMNLTTQQVAEPEPSTSEPAVKSVSILEEYSRTLSTASRRMPVVNALSLRVPNGPEGPKTTIVMALNLPTENVIKQTINTLCANDTVDLTDEPETSSAVPKPTEVQKTVPPVCDIVGVVKGLINAGNKTLTPLSSTASRSLLKVNLEKQSEPPNPRTKTPKIMSLTKSLHVGDVIEIDDTDSNSDDSSNGSRSSIPNSSIPINKSPDSTLYCNKKLDCNNDPVVFDNKSSNSTNSSITKTVSQSTDVCSSKATNLIETKSDNSNNVLQTTESGTDETSKQTVATKINESVDQNESSNTKYITETTSDPVVPASNQLVKISDLISNIGNNYPTNLNINKLTSGAPWNTRKIIEANQPTSSIQTVPTNKSDNIIMFCKIAPCININKNTNFVSQTTTSNQSVTNTYVNLDLNTPSASDQSVSKLTNFNQFVSKTTTPNQFVSKTTTPNQSVSKTKTPNQSVSKTTTSKQSVSKPKTSNRSVSKTKTPKQSARKPKTSKQSVSKTTTSNQPVSRTTTSNQSVSKTIPTQPVSKTTTCNQPISETTTPNESVSHTTTPNQPVNKTTTSKQPVSKTTASKQSTSNINTINDLSGDTSNKPAVGKVVPAVKKPTRSRTPQTRYRWHSMVEGLTDFSEDPAYTGIQTLTTLLDDSQRCPARLADVRAMPDFMAKLSTSVDKEGYCHKASALQVPVSSLPCGATLLCIDAACPPLVLKTQDEPLYKSMPHLRAHLVLTDADLPCKQPTYWTLASYRLMSRVVPDSPVSDVTNVTDTPAVPRVAPGGGCAQWCPEKGEWVTLKEKKKICEKNHNFKVWTAFCTADGVRQAARAGATLFLLNVLRARVLVLTVEREREPGEKRHRHRAIADVDPEILRNLEALIDKAEVEEQRGDRSNIIG